MPNIISKRVPPQKTDILRARKPEVEIWLLANVKHPMGFSYFLTEGLGAQLQLFIHSHNARRNLVNFRVVPTVNTPVHSPNMAELLQMSDITGRMAEVFHYRIEKKYFNYSGQPAVFYTVIPKED